VRVVSLLPAATEIVAGVGAGGWLVGVSHACDYPPEIRDLPRVTRSSIDASGPAAEIDARTAQALATGTALITVDAEALARLAPDLILGQSVCNVCAVGESELAAALASLKRKPSVVTLHAHRLDEVFVDMVRVGAALDLRDEADELVAGLRYRLRTVSTGAPRPAHPRVLVLEWLDPPYVAGHWVPELVAAVGGLDVGARPGEPSMKRSWTELRGLAPEVVIIALCGFDVPRAAHDVAALTDPEALALFRDRRVAFLDGNAYTSRPGPRLVDGAERLSQLIHR
jgi:iron complex transport system substrate-binding protein